MQVAASFVAILSALMLGAMIPGPSFVLVARNAIGLSRRDGLATALGMGIGGLVFAGVALAGLYTLLRSVAWLYVGLKVAGGLYLLYLALQIWRGAKRDFAFDADIARHGGQPLRSLRVGLTTQLSNPKTAIWYGSIFAALLPAHPPLIAYLVLPPAVFAIEMGWYTIVALGFSTRRPRELYLRARGVIDRLAAGAIAVLGLRLILNARGTGL
ncbi:LysE family translocator [Burkholderia gladioli]|uniref:LysE family translocator n=1 Tax=Burkholderia gladioli TaxID=28095 RepID=UPI000D00F5EB|nr:LysE family translocator [Burkholderia gladioli]MBU9277844.1 LysE family translocator [Burkholderia gladioli]PRE26808.1 threonine transporter [Burkholderia gladioli]PRH01984.1 threonine transporter [Burkholderia gladioli]